MLIVYVGIGLWLASVAGVIGLITAAARKPKTPPMDPAIREDRQVEALESWWSLPAFDPREMA